VLQTAKVPSRLLAIILTAGAIVFYLAAANFLGFIITGIIILAVLMWSYGVAFKVLIPVSIIAAVVIHTAFYKFLSVPLPWGVLQPLAW
jgi:putative tricarboxylic transport membrane protein